MSLSYDRSLVVLPLLKANRDFYAPVTAQFAGRRMKSERNPAGSIDKIGWEIYIAVVLPISGGSGRCDGASLKWWLRCDDVSLLHRSFGFRTYWR
jgi:hypothetical protein